MLDIRISQVTIDGSAFKTGDRAFLHLASYMDRAPDRMWKAMFTELQKGLEAITSRMEDMHGTPWSPSGSASGLMRRTGRGLQELAESVRMSGITLGSLQAYMAVPDSLAIHETGGTITPKASKYLAIPLPAALDERGVQVKRRARDWADTFVARSRAGNLLVFRRTGVTVEPLYVLKSRVKLKPKLRFEETVDQEVSQLTLRAADALAQAFEGVV